MGSTWPVERRTRGGSHVMLLLVLDVLHLPWFSRGTSHIASGLRCPGSARGGSAAEDHASSLPTGRGLAAHRGVDLWPYTNCYTIL